MTQETVHVAQDASPFDPARMQRYYPIFLDLVDKPVIVIGGGAVACEKVAGLRKAGARITIVSPELAEELAELRDAGEVIHIARAWRPSDLDENWTVVMVATDDGAVNKEATNESRARRIWVNAADDPANCDFILPSVVRKGKITLAASTAGTSPALARRLREELEDYLTDDMPALADLLAEVRVEVRKRGLRVENETWQRAIDGPLRVLLAQRRYDEARERLVQSLGVADALNGVPATAPATGNA
jgi:siroheme synthase-like protein